VKQGNPWPYEIPAIVFSTRELNPVAESVHVVSGAPGAHREALLDAAAGRDVWIVGGGELAAQFFAAGMLDELIVSIAPVLLGSGRPLFT
ncbi:dihydrofolate reductase family protein, partial [Mycobacterium tuberculosis]|nr:dihydrofolate reductase family protein [Mycobacterium tuberculosis]